MTKQKTVVVIGSLRVKMNSASRVFLIVDRKIFYLSTDTPPGMKSPRGPDTSSRSLSPNRLTKSEPAGSPRKYNKGEVPHGHPDRT